MFFSLLIKKNVYLSSQLFTEQFSPPASLLLHNCSLLSPNVFPAHRSLHHTVAFLAVPHPEEDQAPGLGTRPVPGCTTAVSQESR